MTYYLSKNSKKHRKGVDQRLIAVSDYAIKRTTMDFGHPKTGGKRTQRVQKGLFDRGVSKADGINDLSDHQLGYALDFYAYYKGKTSYDPLHLALVAMAFMEGASRLGVVLGWGGFWGNGPLKKGFTDMPHIYIPKNAREDWR